MVAPRLEIDLDKIYHNAHELVTRLAEHRISVTGITKASLGSVEIANAFLQAGVTGLGDSRIENIKPLRLAGNHVLFSDVPMTLIRSPMLSQVAQVVRFTDISCNTEIEVIKQLSFEAQKQNRIHQILLMVELGDLREGIMPDDLIDVVGEVIGLPHIFLKGIGANLACRCGVVPDATNMALLSDLTAQIESVFNLTLDVVSGGNSANLRWALSADSRIGRINNLRLGEAILLGRETLRRQPIDGLSTDAIKLVAEVIESKVKPSLPTGDIAQTAFGDAQPVSDRGLVRQAILAIGIQDIDPCGMQTPTGINVLGASSDHLIIESSENKLFVGEELAFELDYCALVRAMTSPFVSKIYSSRQGVPPAYAFGKMRSQTLI
ncbi:alanine/ornithine racemase family PLP-dependent enzyme [Ketobacter sp. MCCC 1A13808]|uniref:alanine/ornithine racemase family PLP-dependent enzyme n=1 Tax=Ketobacter sp. MCCC 1A13808 TaxID=2602738 RepID=UPI0012EB4BDE|nr:alanine/ornithine racemase family PLP-dependent enzyme [Ketobacter sp. MCCC 1A13808]MVF14227.1 alanine/ornithine racemase family PLP-dependent enzyme [Ketobacter sp. MCCC 1A13808]